MNIGFDFDGTLSGAPHFENFIKLISPILNNHNIFVVTTRDKITNQVEKQIKNLELKISHKNLIAMGNLLKDGSIESKAQFMFAMNIKCDLFFDNDLHEIEDLRKHNMPCIWIPEMNKDSLMREITADFMTNFKGESFE